MYTLYDDMRFTGHDRMQAWRRERQSWATYSVYRRQANHEVYTPHTILNLVLRGRKRMYDGKTVHRLQAGDVFLIPAGSLLCSEILEQPEGYESINLVLEESSIAAAEMNAPDFVLPDNGMAAEATGLPLSSITAAGAGVLAGQTPASLQVSPLQLPAGPEWQYFMQWLLGYFRRPQQEAPGQEPVTAAALRLITARPGGAAILAMLRQASRHTAPELMQTIGRELSELRELDDLARKSCMSKATLKRRFRQLYHAAPMSWIWQKRLERTCFLLRTTALPITEIAYGAGFENIPHFYRLFRSCYGVTPREWRQM